MRSQRASERQAGNGLRARNTIDGVGKIRGGIAGKEKRGVSCRRDPHLARIEVRAEEWPVCLVDGPCVRHGVRPLPRWDDIPGWNAGVVIDEPNHEYLAAGVLHDAHSPTRFLRVPPMV